MARRAKPLKLQVTLEYVQSPDLVERGFKAWALFVAEHLGNGAPEEEENKST